MYLFIVSNLASSILIFQLILFIINC